MGEHPDLQMGKFQAGLGRSPHAHGSSPETHPVACSLGEVQPCGCAHSQPEGPMWPPLTGSTVLGVPCPSVAARSSFPVAPPDSLS